MISDVHVLSHKTHVRLQLSCLYKPFFFLDTQQKLHYLEGFTKLSLGLSSQYPRFIAV